MRINISITPHSTYLEIIVAIAAPSTPNAGKPNLPKISTQLKVQLTATAIKPATIGATVSPVSRSVLEKIWVTQKGKALQSIILRYCLAKLRVSSIFPELSLS